MFGIFRNCKMYKLYKYWSWNKILVLDSKNTKELFACYNCHILYLFLQCWIISCLSSLDKSDLCLVKMSQSKTNFNIPGKKGQNYMDQKNIIKNCLIISLTKVEKGVFVFVWRCPLWRGVCLQEVSISLYNNKYLLDEIIHLKNQKFKEWILSKKSLNLRWLVNHWKKAQLDTAKTCMYLFPRYNFTMYHMQFFKSCILWHSFYMYSHL